MRYANTAKSGKGIGVEPLAGSLPADRYILITDAYLKNMLYVQDKAQAQELINLLRDASIINGWGNIK
tara:strand:+ start:1285 stop:1488 length:204 start_codon:yes stop_codon:yes gene_type:complete